jgi:hypothetical protein
VAEDDGGWLRERTTHAYALLGFGVALIFGTPALASWLDPHSTPWWVPGAFTLGILGIIFGALMLAAPGLAKLAGPYMPPTVINEAPLAPPPAPAEEAPPVDPGPPLIFVVDDLSATITWQQENEYDVGEWVARVEVYVTNHSGCEIRLLKAQMLAGQVNGRVASGVYHAINGLHLVNGGHDKMQCQFPDFPEHRVPAPGGTYVDQIVVTDDQNETHIMLVTFSA